MEMLIGKEVWFDERKYKVYAQDYEGRITIMRNGTWYNKNEYTFLNPKIMQVIREWAYQITGKNTDTLTLEMIKNDSISYDYNSIIKLCNVLEKHL